MMILEQEQSEKGQFWKNKNPEKDNSEKGNLKKDTSENGKCENDDSGTGTI